MAEHMSTMKVFQYHFERMWLVRERPLVRKSLKRLIGAMKTEREYEKGPFV